MTELMKDDSSKSVIPLFEKAWYGKIRDNEPMKRYKMHIIGVFVVKFMQNLNTLNEDIMSFEVLY